jgi:hypothetical protein
MKINACISEQIATKYIFNIEESDMGHISGPAAIVGCREFNRINTRNAISNISVTRDGRVEVKLATEYAGKDINSLKLLMADIANPKTLKDLSPDGVTYTKISDRVNPINYTMKTTVSKYMSSITTTSKCRVTSAVNSFIQKCDTVNIDGIDQYLNFKNPNESTSNCRLESGHIRCEYVFKSHLKKQSSLFFSRTAKELGCSAMAEALKLELSMVAKSYGCQPYKMSELFRVTDPIWRECTNSSDDFKYPSN